MLGGAVYIISGANSGSIELVEAGAQWAGENSAAMAGAALAGVGDTNGDGLADLVVGAFLDSQGGEDAGAAYLLLGNTDSAAMTSENLSEADAKWLAEDDGDWAGDAVGAAGDTDGDGLTDFLVGASDSSLGGQWSGASYLILGSPDFTSTVPYWLNDAHAKLIGGARYDRAGSSCSRAGDVDGDGYDDVLIGAWGADGGGEDSGGAYLLRGPLAGEVALPEADARIFGNPGDFAGSSVDSAGDIDGDGFDDLLIDAAGSATDEHEEGAAWVMRGPASGTLTLATTGLRLEGELPGDQAGLSVAGVGDMDGDGLGDLLVGAPGSDGWGEDAGAAYLVLGVTASTSLE